MVTSAPTAQPEEDIPLGVSVQLQCPLVYVISEAALQNCDHEGCSRINVDAEKREPAYTSQLFVLYAALGNDPKGGNHIRNYSPISALSHSIPISTTAHSVSYI
jgi:hypothetical protein